MREPFINPHASPPRCFTGALGPFGETTGAGPQLHAARVAGGSSMDMAPLLHVVTVAGARWWFGVVVCCLLVVCLLFVRFCVFGCVVSFQFCWSHQPTTGLSCKCQQWKRYDVQDFLQIQVILGGQLMIEDDWDKSRQSRYKSSAYVGGQSS